MLDLDALEVEAKANLYCQWDMSPKIVLSLIARVRELDREGADQDNIIQAQKDRLMAFVVEQERLRAALYHAEEHMYELAEAWQRGALSEHDGLGGTRSNRNIEVLVEAREVLGDWKTAP